MIAFGKVAGRTTGNSPPVPLQMYTMSNGIGFPETRSRPAGTVITNGSCTVSGCELPRKS